MNFGFSCLGNFQCSNAPWCLNCHSLSCGRSCPCCPPRCRSTPRCICGCLPQPTQCDRFPSIATQFEPPPICRGCSDSCCRPICHRDCPPPKQCGCCDDYRRGNWLHCRPICSCGCCDSPPPGSSKRYHRPRCCKCQRPLYRPWYPARSRLVS